MAYLTGRGMTPTPGHFLGPDGEDFGPHLGAERYTVGQRRGLDIPYGARIYVVGRRGGDILLGPEEALYQKTVFLTDLNFIPFDRPGRPHPRRGGTALFQAHRALHAQPDRRRGLSHL